MKVRILESLVWNNSVWLAGSEANLPADVAERLIAEGKAEAVGTTPKGGKSK